MLKPADMELVREYADSGSEEAFSALVARHLNLVYSVALRRVGNPHQAEEICQAVFIILARKAGRLTQKTVLSGWLYETSRLTAANYLRREVRRGHREQEAHMQSMAEGSEPDAWAKVAPLLEEAMAHLNQTDRSAVVLRFFETRSFQDVGASLGTSEDAAKMRVNRAVEKLRKFFIRRGVAISTAALCAAVAEHSVQAAPPALVASITTTAVKGVGATASKIALIKTTLKIMAWTKAKTAVVIGAGLLLAAGTTTLTVKKIMSYRSYPWQTQRLSSDMLNRLPPQVRIVPTRFPQSSPATVSSNDKVLGIGHPVEDILLTAYDQPSATRMVSSIALPEEKYDFIANLPQHSHEGLQQELNRQFGLSASRQSRQMNVFRLTVQNTEAGGLRPSHSQTASSDSSAGQFNCKNQPISSLIMLLENELKVPVVDETGLTDRFDIYLSWDHTDFQPLAPEALKQALLEQLGLQLTPAKQAIDMLVVQQSR